MRRRFLSKFAVALFTLTVLMATSQSAYGAATIVILNDVDGPNSGFNDPTTVAPVGNNTGTTLGQQRLNAFQFAANIWGATLDSNVTITIRASWEAQSCSSTTGTLGSSGAFSIFRDFPNAPNAGTWYSVALANALSGADLNASSPEIRARFNSNVGNAGCLDADGTPAHFYLGLDNAHGDDLDLVAILMHEFAHGLGFQTFTTTSSGAQAMDAQGPHPSIYDKFLHDNTSGGAPGKDWNQMTNAERAASATNNGNLVWTGPFVTGNVHNVLGTPRVRINTPPGIAGNYPVMATAAFGAPLTAAGVTVSAIQALDPSDGSGASTTDGCSSLTNPASVSGKIALIDRGTCLFVVKVKNAQNAGAVGVIITDNGGNPTTVMGGSDSTITIPSVMVSQTNGNTIKGQPGGSVNATLLVDTSVAQGADAQGRALLYAPTTFAAGSSVSHWDTTAYPNQLMEPADSGDLSHSVAQPIDLTLAQLRDVGWSANPIGDVPFFVRQHYLDFLGREPDGGGLGFWTNDIFKCGIDRPCAEVHSINVSAAFFLSIEFQETGYLVERLYKTAYGDFTGSSTCCVQGTAPHDIPVPMVRFNEFLPDTQQIGQGVIVGVGNWQQQLENNKRAFIEEFVLRSRFTTALPGSMSALDFVNTLNANAGNPLSLAERDQLVNGLNSQTMTRAQVVRAVAEDADLVTAELNRAFVLMQYFGYMRRNPDDPQDTDHTGYDFWLTKLNLFNGNFQQAEMVKAFISSIEYRQRFGP